MAVSDNLTNLTAATDKYAELFENLQSYFLTWYLPIVLVVGVFGNLVILFFLLASRIFPKTILLWLVSICIGDILVLLTDALRMLVKVWFNGLDFRDFTGFSCRAHNYLSNFALIWSAYMQTGISLQRLYMVLWPLKARLNLTFRRVFCAWLVIAICVIFPYFPYLLLWDLNNVTGDCEPLDKWYYYVTTLIDLVIWGMVPLLLMTLATALIILKMSRRDLQMANNDVSKRSSAPPIKSASDSAKNTTQLLVGLNVLYMLSTYPLLIYIMYLNFGLDNKVGVTISQRLHRFIYYLLRSFCYINSSFDWIFYTVSGATFRKRARLLVLNMCCRRQDQQDLSRNSMSARGPPRDNTAF